MIAFITLRERKSRFLVAIKQPDRTAAGVASRLSTKLKSGYRYRGFFKSFTFDNDTAFCQHEKISAAFQAKIYFCEPYKSYQKGSIENGNRQLRALFPRKSDPTQLAQETIDNLVNQLNSKPMKCLGYRSPIEMLNQHTQFAWP